MKQNSKKNIITEKEHELLIESLNKNTASIKRLHSSTNNQEIQKIYETRLIEIEILKTKLTNGQETLI